MFPAWPPHSASGTPGGTPTSTPGYLDKERDNTWLQLPVCPTVLRPNAASLEVKCGPKPEESCPFAHPPENVFRLVKCVLEGFFGPFHYLNITSFEL